MLLMPSTPYFTLLFSCWLHSVAPFTEHSGVINIALEGTMTIGGLVGVLVLVVLPSRYPRLYNQSLYRCWLQGWPAFIYTSLLGFRLRKP